MPSIFLSHNHKDKPFVRKLANDLLAHNIQVWIDEAEIQVGDSLIQKITSGIYQMDYLGIILSPNSINSRWVQEELQQALHIQISEGYVKVLPLLLENCNIPGFLCDKAYADFRDESLYLDSLTKLIDSMSRRYDYLQQAFPSTEQTPERISDYLIKNGFDSFVAILKQGGYSEDNLEKFLTNQFIQSSIRTIVLRAYLASGRRNNNLFTLLLRDFDQEVRKLMIQSIAFYDIPIESEVIEKILTDPISSNDVILYTVKLTCKLVKEKKIDVELLLHKKIVNNSYWRIRLDAIEAIIAIDPPNGIEILSKFKSVTYHVSRKRIIDYIDHLLDQKRINNENDRQLCEEILTKWINDGNSHKIIPEIHSVVARLQNDINAS